MVRESVKLLSSSLLASQVPDSIDESDAIDAGADADDWMWAGTPLSPMLR
jgi:methylaspartate ammonia-lyase